MKESTQKLIETLEARQAEITKVLAFIHKHHRQFDNLPDVAVYTQSIDFNHLRHNQIIQVVSTFGGKWEKTPTGIDERIDYQTKIDGVTIRCWAGEPPPSCKIVEEEIEVPAQPARKQIVRKLVCKETEVA